MDDMAASEAAKLKWDAANGAGFFPVDLSASPYEGSYWEKYLGYAQTPMGEAITRARLDLVRAHAPEGKVVDVGIGCGQFIEACEVAGVPVGGYDVNVTAIKWLLERKKWHDPWFQAAEHATCWDSLEHMERPELFLARVKKTLFLSIPIFEDRAHVLRSHHFRPTEHFWYFTRWGLVTWMHFHGFDKVTENMMETELGRVDIGTFVFRRRAR